MEKILRECLGCGLQAKKEKDLQKFLQDKYKPNHHFTKPWCKQCAAKSARIRKTGPMHGPFLIKKCNDCGSLAQSMEDMKKRFVKEKECRYGHSNLCKSCNSKRAQRHAKENPEMFKKRTRSYTLRKYGLSYEKYEEMLKKQNNCCSICKKSFETTGKSPHVDHDHSCCSSQTRSCGKCIRGILCVRCNMFLGAVEDDIMLLESAIKYLRGVD